MSTKSSKRPSQGTAPYLSINDKSGPYVITGPVIGMVTENSARILIEMSHDANVKCTLTSKTGNRLQLSKNFKAKRPAAFTFDDLEPETQYKVGFNTPVPGLVKVGFRTLPANWDIQQRAANIAFVSCNKYKITRDEVSEGTDLWKDIFKRASRGEIDYLIHMGDNVYADTDLYAIENGERTLRGLEDDCRWHIAMEMLKDVPSNEWHLHFEKICEVFRAIYRETWNHPPTKHALANVPNLMILDDHDIRDDWGDRDVDRDPMSLDFFVGCCAYEVYNEYQRNLFEDYEPALVAHDACRVGQAYHFHVFGDIGIMMVDSRASKSFHRNYDDPSKDNDLPMLGHAQWKDIEMAFSPSGYFSTVRMLFVVTPMPICYVGEGPNMAAAKVGGTYFDDLFGSWAASCHIPEASLLLSAIFDWRAKGPGHREVVICSGDVHQGGYTDIADLRYVPLRDPRIDRIKQITTSAISNKMAKPREHVALQFARSIVNSIGKWHQFYHYDWTPNRNFAILNAKCDRDPLGEKRGVRDAGQIVPQYEFQLFTANASGKKRSKKYHCTHRTFSLAGGLAACSGTGADMVPDATQKSSVAGSALSGSTGYYYDYDSSYYYGSQASQASRQSSSRARA
eukprot:Polyplicarium_translucidae@DN1144_c0_g1_i1.p1